MINIGLIAFVAAINSLAIAAFVMVAPQNALLFGRIFVAVCVGMVRATGLI